jgi:hypothetical protein
MAVAVILVPATITCTGTNSDEDTSDPGAATPTTTVDGDPGIRPLALFGDFADPFLLSMGDDEYVPAARFWGPGEQSEPTEALPELPEWTEAGGPIVCDVELGGSIDPSPYSDGERTWLVWKSDGNCCGIPTTIRVQETSADGTRVVYHGWSPGAVGYDNGGMRRLYVEPVDLGARPPGLSFTP